MSALQHDPKGILLRTLADVKAALAQAKWKTADAALATLLQRHRNLTDEAREWIAREYPKEDFSPWSGALLHRGVQGPCCRLSRRQ